MFRMPPVHLAVRGRMPSDGHGDGQHTAPETGQMRFTAVYDIFSKLKG